MSDEGLRRTYQDMIARDPAPDRSQCPTAERLHDLVSRSGPEDNRLALANHVMACPHCLPEFELLRSMAEAMPEKRPVPRWLALAASIALLLAAGIVGRQLLQSRHDVLREHPAIRLIAPGNGDRIAAPIRLVWGRVPETIQYQVQILTTEGEVAFESSTADTTMLVDSLVGTDFIWRIAAEYSTGEPTRSRPARFSVTTP